MGTALTRDARPPGDRAGAAPTDPVEVDDPVVAERARDDRLARRVRTGDDRAFEALYWRYQVPLSRYARSIVGSEADAQDVMQTAMTKALLALRANRRDAPMKAWLFRIVHNEAISLLRRRPPGTDRDPESIVELALGESRAADVVAEERAALATLVADLNELGERQRAALVLRELSGLTHEEIAAALGISVGVARQTVLEARRSLMEFGQGREMSCEEIQTLVSAGDRRTLKARRVRGHLRDCQACTAFSGAIDARSRALSVLAPPLPIAAAALPLLGALGHTGGTGGTATTGGSGASGAATGTAGGSASGSAALTTKAGLGAISAVKVAAGGAALVAAAGGSLAVLGHAGRPHRAGGAPMVHSDVRSGDRPTSGQPGGGAGAQRTPAGAFSRTYAGHSPGRDTPVGAGHPPAHAQGNSDGHAHGAGATHASGRSARLGAGPPRHAGSTTHGRAGTAGSSATHGGAGHHSNSGSDSRSSTHGTLGIHGRSGGASASGRHGGAGTHGPGGSSRRGGTSSTTSGRPAGTGRQTSSTPTGTPTTARHGGGRGGASASTGSSGSGSANATAGTAGTTTTGTTTTGTAAGGGDTSGAGTASRGTVAGRTTPSTGTPPTANLGTASPAGGLPSGSTTAG